MMPLDDETLQRYFDCDLPEDEERRVRERLADDHDAVERLAQFAQVRTLLREVFETEHRQPDSDAMFARILAEVSAPAGPVAARAAPLPETYVRPPLRDVSEKRPARRRGVMLPAFASLAVAAAAMLVFLGQHNGDVLEGGPAHTIASTSPGAAPVPSGSRIDDVDFGASTGTVFEIDNGGVSAAVVWISDDEETAQ